MVSSCERPAEKASLTHLVPASVVWSVTAPWPALAAATHVEADGQDKTLTVEMPAMSASWDHFVPLSVVRMKPLGSMAVQTDAEGHEREVTFPSLRPVGMVSGFQLIPPLVVRITSGTACLVPDAWHTVADWQTTDPRY
jgi:hypothetical protein